MQNMQWGRLPNMKPPSIFRAILRNELESQKTFSHLVSSRNSITSLGIEQVGKHCYPAKFLSDILKKT